MSNSVPRPIRYVVFHRRPTGNLVWTLEQERR
jgi:hypothetical protein